MEDDQEQSLEEYKHIKGRWKGETGKENEKEFSENGMRIGRAARSVY